jgi:hypothetical protein
MNIPALTKQTRYKPSYLDLAESAAKNAFTVQSALGVGIKNCTPLGGEMKNAAPALE